MTFVSVKVDKGSWDRFKQRFDRKRQDKVLADVSRETVAAGFFLLDQVQQNIIAQGIVHTGAYLNSWHITVQPAINSIGVGTSHPAAHRKEYGFTGRDSLGRIYNDPAHPHLRPAIAVTKTRTFDRVRVAVMKDLE